LRQEVEDLKSSLAKVEYDFQTCVEIQERQYLCVEEAVNQLGDNLKSLSQLYLNLSNVLHKFKRDKSQEKCSVD